MLAFGDEALEICPGFADRVGPRYADGVKALRACLLGKRRPDGARF